MINCFHRARSIELLRPAFAEACGLLWRPIRVRLVEHPSHVTIGRFAAPDAPDFVMIHLSTKRERTLKRPENSPIDPAVVTQSLSKSRCGPPWTAFVCSSLLLCARLCHDGRFIRDGEAEENRRARVWC